MEVSYETGPPAGWGKTARGIPGILGGSRDWQETAPVSRCLIELRGRLSPLTSCYFAPAQNLLFGLTVTSGKSSFSTLGSKQLVSSSFFCGFLPILFPLPRDPTHFKCSCAGQGSSLYLRPMQKSEPKRFPGK